MERIEGYMESWKRRSKIDEVTAPDTPLPPVYIMDEIFNTIKSSPPDVVAEICDALQRKLEHKNPVVLAKALRVVRYLCNKGPTPFPRAMQKHAGSIRNLQSFKGAADALKGDAPNQAVRTAANEALAVLFQQQPQQPPSTGGGGARQGGRIQGFGNDNISESVSRGNDQLSSGNSYRDGGFNFGGQGGGGGGNGSRMMGFGTPKSGGFGPAASKAGSTLLRDSGSSNNAVNAAAVSGRSTSLNDSYRAPAGGAELDLSEEQRLVEQICAGGGVRPAPSREELATFVDCAGNLDGTFLATSLQDCMQGSSWQAALRACCVLEAVVSRGSSVPCGEIAVYFQQNPTVLQNLMASSVQGSVKEKARKVIQLLGVESAAQPDPAPPSTAPPAPLPTAVPDLLLDLADPIPQISTPSNTSGDMFAGLDVGPGAPSNSSVPEAAAGDSLFDGLTIDTESTRAAPAHAPHSNAADDLLGGLSGLSVGGPPSTSGPPQGHSAGVDGQISSSAHPQMQAHGLGGMTMGGMMGTVGAGGMQQQQQQQQQPPQQSQGGFPQMMGTMQQPYMTMGPGAMGTMGGQPNMHHFQGGMGMIGGQQNMHNFQGGMGMMGAQQNMHNFQGGMGMMGHQSAGGANMMMQNMGYGMPLPGYGMQSAMPMHGGIMGNMGGQNAFAGNSGSLQPSYNHNEFSMDSPLPLIPDEAQTRRLESQNSIGSTQAFDFVSDILKK